MPVRMRRIRVSPALLRERKMVPHSGRWFDILLKKKNTEHASNVQSNNDTLGHLPRRDGKLEFTQKSARECLQQLDLL